MFRPAHALLAGVAVAALLTGAAVARARAQVQGQGQTQTQAAQTAEAPLPAMTAEERARTVESLAQALIDNFVFPETGQAYAERIRARLASGAYDGFSDPKAFGKAVTDDLQAVARDGHLRLATEVEYGVRRDEPPSATPPRPRADAKPPLEEARMIGDVAYLRFNLFPMDEAVTRQARDFLLANQNARAVIIDARPHRGGGLMQMDALLPLLYAEPTTLVRMDTRAAVAADGPVREGPTLKRQPSPDTVVRFDHVVTPDASARGLQRVPVYYLTSNRSASAAEHLALAFKRTGRATLVGETTRGAGHYGGLQPIGDRFAAFVPVGRTYDPDTGQGWEGTGVKPDVEVPADRALDEALRLARQAGANPG